MSGFDDSSSERYSGRLLLEVTPAQSPEAADGRVDELLRIFVQAIDAGFFHPARLQLSPSPELRSVGASVHGLWEVEDLPLSALGVLAGMLAHGRHDDSPVLFARALLGRREIDLLSATLLRPAAPESPPFELEFPEDMGGNYALLVEIEFAQPVMPEQRQGMLETLALWDALTLAYPLDSDEPVEVSGAQAMFNDPRTIHYHEWVWDNADPLAWDLLVNLCCVWHRTWPIVRLHFE